MECLPATLRNPSTASVAHAADAPAHIPVRLYPVRVQGRIASDHRPREGLVVEVNVGEGVHRVAWSPSMHEVGAQTDAQSEETSPLDCVHEGRESVKDNRVAVMDARGTQGVLDALVHAPIHGGAQEVAHAYPMAHHALGEVPHEGSWAAIAVPS